MGIISLLLPGCFEPDKRVVPYPDAVTTIPDSVQIYQSFFDFESGRVVTSYRASSWQLGFECGAEGWHIITNSGAGWFMYNTGSQNPDVAYSMPQNLKELFDRQHAWPDSTAVGNWVSPSQSGNTYTKNVYLLGRFAGGTFSNLTQLVFLDVNDSTYTFYERDQESGAADSITISKNDSVNFVYFSVVHKRQENLEPDKTSYDIVFGSYYDMATLFGQTIPYQVGGVLLNVWNTSVSLDSTDIYADIGSGTVPGLQFTHQRDIPGYRWKTVVVDITGGGAATYSVKTLYNYIFLTAQGNYFKLRFLSYTLDGRSGYPRFEYNRLE